VRSVPGVEGLEVFEEPVVAGDDEASAEGVVFRSFGKKAELMSPMPGKNSTVNMAVDQSDLTMRFVKPGLTGHHLDQIWPPAPYISSVIDDHDHALIDRE
jgi:hypothetical protein